MPGKPDPDPPLDEELDALPLPDFDAPELPLSGDHPAVSRPPSAGGSMRPGFDDDSRAVAPEVRIRRLPAREQLKLARTSSNPTERTVLERLLGRAGWEQLLRNPNLTPPEVARIARKGTVPLPLIEKIVQNRRWAEVPTVRRALLSNPKLTNNMIHRILRSTPAHELKLMQQQTAYPRTVRAIAAKMIGAQKKPGKKA